MFSTPRLLALLLAAASIEAIPIPKPQTPDFHTLDSCPTDGAIICSPDGSKFFMCNFGKAMPMGAVAAGMVCRDGSMMALGSSAMPSEMPVSSPPSQPTPTTTTSAMMTSIVMEPTMAPAPTSVPSEPQEDTSTSTIYLTKTIQSTRTSTIKITTVSEAPVDTTVPSLTMATSIAAVQTTSEVTTEPTVPPSGGSQFQVTPQQVFKIAPNSAVCDPVGPECGTYMDATPFINEALTKYNIGTIGEAAAIISLMAFESVDFKYNHNVFPGRPGQGTKAMLMPNFVVSYAQTFGSTDSIAPGLNEQTINSASDDVKVAVLALVQPNDKTYGSAAWYYSTKCTDDVKAGLKASPVSVAAWSSYITNCVNTGVDGRKAGFLAAVEALGGTTTE